jgi:pSer/pThr/pTyr-binding forkhead associated (FHA) protein
VIRVKEREVILVPGETISIGRHLENDLVIHSPSVSRFHASIRWLQERLLPEVLDHGSQNGTVVDGVEVGRSPVAVRGDALLLLGSRLVQVRVNEPGSQALLRNAPDVVMLFSERGQERGGTFAAGLELAKILRELEAEERTGTLWLDLRTGEAARITLCEGKLMAVEKGDAAKTRALELLLIGVGGHWRFVPELEPVDDPLNLHFTNFYRRWRQGYTPRRPRRKTPRTQTG